VKGRLRKNRVW